MAAYWNPLAVNSVMISVPTAVDDRNFTICPAHVFGGECLIFLFCDKDWQIAVGAESEDFTYVPAGIMLPLTIREGENNTPASYTMIKYKWGTAAGTIGGICAGRVNAPRVNSM
jgi:hypothetical protein